MPSEKFGAAEWIARVDRSCATSLQRLPVKLKWR
jgi:hypothetical protein